MPVHFWVIISLIRACSTWLELLNQYLMQWFYSTIGWNQNSTLVKLLYDSEFVILWEKRHMVVALIGLLYNMWIKVSFLIFFLNVIASHSHTHGTLMLPLWRITSVVTTSYFYECLRFQKILLLQLNQTMLNCWIYKFKKNIN